VLKGTAAGWNRLVYVHNAAVPSQAANAVQVTKTCAAFQDAGMPTMLVIPSGMAGSAEETRRCYNLQRDIDLRTAPSPSLPGRELIYGALASLRYGVSGRPLFYTRSVSIASSIISMRHEAVLEMHGPVTSLRPALKARLLALSMSQRLRQLIVISEALKRHYEELVPALRARICVAHDAADPIPDGQVPRMLDGDFKVGYVGQLYPGKGMELISAIAPLCPKATFHVVGGVEKDVGQWRNALRFQSNVVFHGYVPHSETAAFIAAMDVVVAPYLRVVRGVGIGESNLADWMSPLKLFEYMAAGKAIVTSDLPVLREVVVDGQEALLCDPDNPQQWADVLAVLGQSPRSRAELGLNALRKFLSNYTWDQRALRILTRLRDSH
jgi:glycosyltransferase involved in cell wall biosynthesis